MKSSDAILALAALAQPTRLDAFRRLGVPSGGPHGMAPHGRPVRPAPPPGGFPDLPPASPLRPRRPGLTVTIRHNPACGVSRNALALVRASGEELEVGERLVDLIAAAGLTVREAVRRKGTPHEALGVADPALTDGALLDAMLAHPLRINRPFVETPLGARLARPSEQVLEISTTRPPSSPRTATWCGGPPVADGERPEPAGAQAFMAPPER